MNWRLILGLAMIGLAFWIDESPRPIPAVDYNAVLGLEDQKTEPTGVREEVTDQIDRENIAIIHNEMGKRLPNYSNVNTLQFEKFYVDSTKEFFGDSLVGKYRDLGEKMYKLILSTLGESEGQITQNEMSELSKRMRGLAWEILN